MKARKEVSSLKEGVKPEIDEKDATKFIEETDKSKNDDKEVIDIDLNDPEVENAATKIQAGFKGMKARKEVSALKEGPKPEIVEKETTKLEETEKNKNDEEVIDIDLNDPEVENAATKIQVGFKGMKA